MRKKQPDFILLFTISILVMSGLIMILSASSIKAEQLFSNSYYFFNNQLKYLAVALVLAAVIYKLKYKKLNDLAPYLLLISLGTLILVLVPGMGIMAGGSRRWLPLGPISFQPSELAKFILVIYLAAYIDKNKDKMKKFKPQKDKTIDDKYILKEFLGSGSYGYVWRSIKLENEEVVALKIPKKQESGDKVLKEGSKLQGHTHPNIIDINWMGRVDGVFVIEMEYFESHTLAEEIKEKGHIKPRLFTNLYDLFFQILEAIDFMHSLNVCHGDIKPDNILLGDKVKITDFGTSKLIEDLFVETIGVGTCGFIAPEVVNSHRRYLTSDIYSLGALLYFLL